MPKLNIRKATEQDASKIIRFLKKIYSENLDTLFKKDSVPSILKEEYYIRQIYRYNGVIFIAEILNVVVGMITARRYEHPQVAHSVLIGISVLKDFRNRGIGKKLMDTIKLWAKENKVKRIELQVFSINLKALEFYLREGFDTECIKQGAVLIKGGYYDIIQMVYPLDERIL